MIMHRRTAPKVKDGRVQRKNRWTRPVNTVGANGVAIERVHPGKGFQHAVSQDELFSFLHNLPDWPDLARGLNRIILDEGWDDWYGYYRAGTIGLRAFYRDFTIAFDPAKRLRDRDFFEMLAVDVEQVMDLEAETPTVTQVICHVTRPIARAFMLVHVLSHEFGHHVDRMQNQLRFCPHGEPFAYRYEWSHAPQFWQTYLRVFGDPRKER